MSGRKHSGRRVLKRWSHLVTELGRRDTQAVKAWARQWTSNLILFMFVYTREHVLFISTIETRVLISSFAFAWRRILQQPGACKHHYTVVGLFFFFVSSCLTKSKDTLALAESL
jgi:hypothetical protein